MSFTKEYLEAKYGKVLTEEEFNKEYGFKIVIADMAITSKDGKQVSCAYQKFPNLYYDFKSVSCNPVNSPISMGGDYHLFDNK